MDALEEQVQIAIGHASMCWSEIPPSVYDDQKAAHIAQELIVFIRAWLASEQHEKESVEEAPQVL